MPTEDAARWNLRYQDDPRTTFDLPRSLLYDHSDLIPTHGLALDLAMGLGDNANFLLNLGLRVIGVDISYVALRKVKSRLSNLMAVVADLEHFYIPPNTFDVVINFLYLQRDLWLPMILGLKKDGIIFIECLTKEMLTIHPEINSAYLLKQGELQQVLLKGDFGKDIELLFYYEGWQALSTSHPRAVASLIARKNA